MTRSTVAVATVSDKAPRQPDNAALWNVKEFSARDVALRTETSRGHSTDTKADLWRANLDFRSEDLVSSMRTTRRRRMCA